MTTLLNKLILVDASGSTLRKILLPHIKLIFYGIRVLFLLYAVEFRMTFTTLKVISSVVYGFMYTRMINLDHLKSIKVDYTAHFVG